MGASRAWLLLCIVVFPTLVMGEARAGTPVSAIWRTQQIDFRMDSQGVQFRCEEFVVRLSSILAAIGATLEPTSRLQCSQSFSTTFRGSLVVKSPFVADANTLARARAEISSSDRLLAHLRGQGDPSEAIRSFAADWRAVSATTHPSLRRLDSGDCELLQSLVRQLLPRISVKDVRLTRSCRSHGAPRFSALALVSVEDVDAISRP